MKKKIKDGVISVATVFIAYTAAVVVVKSLFNYTAFIWNLW